MLRNVFVGASRVAFNTIYRIARKDRRENLAVFLSRQYGEPSYDYAELAREFERRGWDTVMLLKKVRARNMVGYAAHVVREIILLGRCKVAVIDRYDPVISLIDFECENDSLSQKADAVDDTPAVLNVEFPKKPLILQVWHAFGAYKNFGFQSNNTSEGHTTDFTDVYRIHRNCSWVLCSGEGARDAFAEAFSCPKSRVVALVRPEYDELMHLRSDRNSAARHENAPYTVLMAPTLRYSEDSAHPFRDLYENRETFENAVGANVVWSFHPLEEGLPAPGNVSAHLLEADCVVTDYSSIAYEAYLLGIPVLFYVPDLESYRLSPGLNADPGHLCPDLCFNSDIELARYLSELATGTRTYPAAAFESFASSGFDPETPTLPGTAASRIVDFTLSRLP